MRKLVFAAAAAMLSTAAPASAATFIGDAVTIKRIQGGTNVFKTVTTTVSDAPGFEFSDNFFGIDVTANQVKFRAVGGSFSMGDILYEISGLDFDDNASTANIIEGFSAAFARECAFDLGGRRLKLDSLWVNVLKPGGAHSGHIHPHSVVSGTVYIAVPPGSGALKLEDPRLPMLMAAPARTADAPEDMRTFVYAEPKPGTVFLWESWLRHEVVPGTGRGDRISISFNYRL